MSDDPFEQGHSGEAPTYNAPLEDQFAYQDGVAAREREQRQQEQADQTRRDEQDRLSDERRQADEAAASSMRSGGGTGATGAWSSPSTSEPEDESDDLLASVAVFVPGAAIIAWAVSSFALHRPDAFQDAAMVAGATYVVLLGIWALASGVGGTVLALIVTAVCSLLGAGLGYAIGIVGHRPDPFEFVIPAALIGAAVGGLLGVGAAVQPDD